MPRRKQHGAAQTRSAAQTRPEGTVAPVRALWSGTITFGLVSIPVDLLTAVRPRQTAMKLVDKAGHALGRQFHCSKDGRKLAADDIVRGYQTADGEMVVMTDADFESVAPEMSADIELRNFVPLEQIPPIYFQRPYILAPAGKSAKAYHLLAATMERTGRVGIGSFVMRGHEYLVAIISDHGVLRADTLRYADEVRSPQSIGLPKRTKAAAARVREFARVIDDLTRTGLDVAELEDKEAAALQTLVETKRKRSDDVIRRKGLEGADAETEAGDANVIDLMEVLRKSLSKSTVVRNVQASPPISLAERRARNAERARPGKHTKNRTSAARRGGRAKGRSRSTQRA